MSELDGVFGPGLAEALGFPNETPRSQLYTLQDDVLYVRDGQVWVTTWPAEEPWTDDERSRRLQQFDIDRASFRRAYP